MIILVAGGGGFIGSHLCEKLIRENHQVICVDNLSTGLRENLYTLISNKNFEFVKKDINEMINIKKKIDIIFHLASPASPNPYSQISYLSLWKETFLTNTLGTVNLLELALKNQAIFLYASTSEIYGNPQIHPQPENYWGNVNPVGVRSIYDESKRAGETICYYYSLKKNVDVRIVRIFNTYGPRMRLDDKRMIINFIHQALTNKPITIYGNGHQTRSLCYIDDLINGLILIAFKNGLKGQVINLGNPEEYRVIDYARMIKKITGSKSRIIFLEKQQDDPERRRPDIAKAISLLNWQPIVDINIGLKKTVEYYRSIIKK
ncbi:MAG: NAD-dependent epimerase/dehydratase family protein [Patescibacteria group bacterium]|nr:NAD-dependent epimerase/dehydratase family protein [Patescibacteria group bacterium]